MAWLYDFLYSKKDAEIFRLSQAVEKLSEQIIKEAQQSELEQYYNNKYPKTVITYAGRQMPNKKQNVKIDVRNFFNPEDSEIHKLTTKILHLDYDDDKIAFECLFWVVKNFKYISDKTKGANEFWQFPYESLHYMTGDCEDGAILLANMLLVAGVPYWKIRLSAGWVEYNGKRVGHAYLTYYCEQTKKWVILDWCYYPSLMEIADRPDYKEEKKYQDVWFSWNQKYCYTKGLNTDAMRLLK